jgi:hypothetical protein
MPGRKGRIRAVIIVFKLLERDGSSVEIYAFSKGVTGVVRCKVVNIEYAFPHKISIIITESINTSFTLKLGVTAEREKGSVSWFPGGLRLRYRIFHP